MVLIAGNHDYIRKDSYYRTFQWSPNVHMLTGELPEAVELPDIGTAVYGFSYHARQIQEALYDHLRPEKRQPVEILLAHGGDASHIPVDRNCLAGLGYDYIALGHIHMPQIVIPGMAAYAGSLEPTDLCDTGPHGYIAGEISRGECRFSFVPSALREYIRCEIQVDRQTTGASLREEVRELICRKGIQNMYRLVLKGYRDPDILFDPGALDPMGNVTDITDETKPAWDMEKLYLKNRSNLIGRYIESFAGADPDSAEYAALCEGISALMETRRGVK